MVGDLVALNGNGSSDIDGDPLTYSWSLTAAPAGSTAVLLNPLGPTPSFVINTPGDYVAQLIVNDGTVDSAPDTVVIRTDGRPVANAGADRTGLVGDSLQLDGSVSSDPDSDMIGFSWTIVGGPVNGATLSAPTTVNPTFAATAAGTYTVQLVVSDGRLDSLPDTTDIVYNRGAHRPSRPFDRENLAGHDGRRCHGSAAARPGTWRSAEPLGRQRR